MNEPDDTAMVVAMSLTLTPHITRYVAGRRSRGEFTARTATGVRSQLGKLDRSFGRRGLHQLTRTAIERWMETIGHLSPAHRRNALSAVRGFCRWLVDQGHIADDPTAKIAPIRQPRSVPRALPVDAVARILHTAPDPRAKAIIMLMVGCGLRCVEVSRLTVTDYDPDAATIAVTGKGGHERILPVPDGVGATLDAYLATVGITTGPLIRASRVRANGLSAATISTYVSRWMASAGLKAGRWDGRSAHALRHTCASDVLDGGADLRVVQEMLGHQHLATTSIYLRRASLGQMRDAMEGRTYVEGGDHARATERPHAPTGLVRPRAA